MHPVPLFCWKCAPQDHLERNRNRGRLHGWRPRLSRCLHGWRRSLGRLHVWHRSMGRRHGWLIRSLCLLSPICLSKKAVLLIVAAPLSLRSDGSIAVLLGKPSVKVRFGHFTWSVGMRSCTGEVLIQIVHRDILVAKPAKEFVFASRPDIFLLYCKWSNGLT